jgi:hypothetical protein
MAIEITSYVYGQDICSPCIRVDVETRLDHRWSGVQAMVMNDVGERLKSRRVNSYCFVSCNYIKCISLDDNDHTYVTALRYVDSV